MKKLILPVLLLSTQFLFSQISKIEEIEEIKNNAKEIKMHLTTPHLSEGAGGRCIVFSDDYSISHEKALEYSKSFCISENVDFNLKNSHITKDGKTLYRYEQTIDGYPVEFTAWHIHEKNGRVTTLNGDIVNVQNFSPIFSISENEALQAALNHIVAEMYMWQDENEEQLLKSFQNDINATYYPSGIKVIIPISMFRVSSSEIQSSKFKKEPKTLNLEPALDSGLIPAFKFDIFSKFPYNRKMIYVDAQTGEILLDLPLIHFNDVIGTAYTQYCGIQQINTFYSGTQYILRDNTRGNGINTYNCHNTSNTYAATEFFDDDNIWNNINTQLDQYATDAHFATMSTYDYYYNIHGRNSINNYGFQLRSYVHFNLIQAGYPNNINAFWNGNWMVYGDGAINQGITPLTTIDICGHEITHGLTSFTADLLYLNESGALSEAFSDIFGTAIEFYTTPEDANWTIGEKMGMTIRSLQNPKAYGCPNTYKGQYWIYGSQDYGGVHYNCGVLSYWFYLLCEGGSGINDLGNAYQVEAIGMEKAEKIAFKLLTEYLTPNSQYIDAYNYSILASDELFGICSSETKSVGDAFYAVGVITSPFINEIKVDFKASETIVCEFPNQVTFSNKTNKGISYLWDFGDGFTSEDINPVHSYSELGNYTVTLSAEGGECGSGVETKENYIKVDTSLICNVIMPVNGHNTIEGCAGNFYDCGGPNQNYLNNANSRLTIYAPYSEYIVLEIEEFDIEPGGWGNNCNYDWIAFYDGNSISAPLINNTKYCNSNGNPGTISSTGQYITIQFVSDAYINFSGYKISFYCVGGPSPEPDFSVNTETTCDGFIIFTDESTNSPEEWQWDFGDGNTSFLQNPTHQYSENGIYSVSLTVSNQNGENSIQKENYITVEIPEPPQIDDIEACNDIEFDIELDLVGIAYWYENMDDEEPIHIGNSWNHLPIEEEITYFLREIFEDNCASDFTEVRLIPKTCVVSIKQIFVEDIVLFPNPFTNEINISNSVSVKSIEIYDAMGRKVQSYETLNPKLESVINVSHLSGGIYFIMIESITGDRKIYKMLKK